MDLKKSSEGHVFTMAGIFTLSLRLVTGWTYFSAFWRRLVLADKLDVNSAGYIGEKFNHFLPNSLLLKPFIEYLVTHGETLWWFMMVFTIVEAVVGLLFILGLFTRLMSIGVFGLAMGILLSAGWLGTTCLDEWQIGVLGMAAGFTVFLSGGGYYSLDNYFSRKRIMDGQRNIFKWIGSGKLNMSDIILRKVALIGTVFIVGITLFTNQYFHGGLWGKLHNLSIKPHIEISDARVDEQNVSFTVFRNEGADVYGSFLVKVELFDKNKNLVVGYNADVLSALQGSQVDNKYIAKVEPGKYSLVIPLGAMARITLPHNKTISLSNETYSLKLTDISGLTWTSIIE